MFPNIVFDMGGVLLDFSEARQIAHFFGNFSEEEQNLVREALFGSGLWRCTDRGDFGEEEMIAKACALLPEKLHAAAADIVLHAFDAMPPLPANELIPLLKARGQRVFLLTNVPCAFHREKHRLPYLHLFDGILASCDVGLLKPDPEIYLAFLEKFGLQAQDCLFIDDMPVNIAGARSVGMYGHCFEKRDLQELKRELEL